VLNAVELRLDPGQVVQIVGANGAGKTTFLRIVAGLIFPDAGRVQVDGLEPRRDRRAYQRKVSFMPAGDAGLYPRLSVARHLDLTARLALLSRTERRRALEASIARFDLGEIADQWAGRLSAGQRKRLRLALAFLQRPTAALLDEPHNSLDRGGLALLEEALLALKEEGGNAILCSPETDAIGAGVDEVYVLEKGALRQWR
jgi:ABC-type multidrug transport system ATPase subunit